MTAASNSALGTIKLTGDLQAGSGENPVLVPSGVIPGEYATVHKIHVDSKGRIVWVGGEPEELKEDVPLATHSVVGSVKPGKNITYSNNTIDVDKGSTTTVGIVKLGDGLEINGTTGATDVVIPDATTTSFGKARGNNLAIIADNGGDLYVNPIGFCQEVGKTSSSQLGFMKIGYGLNIVNGDTLAVNYPIATTSTLGAIKPGEGFSVAGEYLSAKFASNTEYGIINNSAQNFYIDPNNKIYLHACWYSLYGHIYGVSGPNISIDNSTHTLSANYSFNDFSDICSASTFGKTQIGNNINVSNGVISVPFAGDGTYGAIKTSGRIFKITVDGELYADYSYPASSTYFGCVKPDNYSITIDNNNVISCDLESSNNSASATQKGLVRVGSGLSFSSGIMSADIATTSAPGIVQIGSGLSVGANGLISINNDYFASTTHNGIVKLSPEMAYDDGTGNLDYSKVSLNLATTERNGGILLFNNGGPLDLSFGQVGTNDGASYTSILSYDHTQLATSGTCGVVKTPGGFFNSYKASTDNAGTISVNQDQLLSVDNGIISLATAGTNNFGVVKGDYNGGINILSTDGTMTLSDSATTRFGVVKVGSGLYSTIDGTLSLFGGALKLDKNQVLGTSIYKPKVYPSYEPINYPVVNIQVTNDDNTFLNSDVRTLILFNPTIVNVDKITINLVRTNFENSPAINCEQDIKILYTVVNKYGTNTPVDICLSSGWAGGYGGPQVQAGDIVLITVKQVTVNNLEQFYFKSAEIFK